MKNLNELIFASEIIDSKIDFHCPVLAITNNSNEVKEGTLFFAISGNKNDGHNFIKDTIERKARAIIVEKEEFFRNFPNTVLVPSTRKAFALASSRWFDEPSKKMKIVAVTGTNGKTTITYLLKHIWQKMNRKVGIIGTIEYLSGSKKEPAPLTTPDPLSLQRLLSEMWQSGVTHVAMEASSIALHQMRITGTELSVGIFTNLTQDHLDYHLTMKNYFESKRLLFTELKPKAAIINLDDNYGREIYEEKLIPLQFGYSIDGNGDFSAHQFKFDLKSSFSKIKTPYGVLNVRYPLIGKHNLSNLLSVIAASHSLGDYFSPSLLENLKAPPGRLELVEYGDKKPYVFVDYAHTPDALKNILTAISQVKNLGRIITVFGCGGNRDREKRPKMGKIVSLLSDVTIVTSDNPRMESPESIIDEIESGIKQSSTEYIRKTDRKKAIFKALSLANPTDIVVIAGKGHETYQIIGTEKIHFDDREVVKEYFKNKEENCSRQ